VTSNAIGIARAEGAREDVCATAALKQEPFTLPESHPDSPERLHVETSRAIVRSRVALIHASFEQLRSDIGA
jgi:hypothetical protein